MERLIRHSPFRKFVVTAFFSLPWVIIALFLLLDLQRAPLRQGFNIAEDVVNSAEIFGGVPFRKEFSVGKTNVWRDMTGSLVLFERTGKTVAILSVGVGVEEEYLELFRDSVPTVFITFSELNESMMFKAASTNGGDKVVVTLDTDWSGVPERRIIRAVDGGSPAQAFQYSPGDWKILDN